MKTVKKALKSLRQTEQMHDSYARISKVRHAVCDAALKCRILRPLASVVRNAAIKSRYAYQKAERLLAVKLFDATYVMAVNCNKHLRRVAVQVGVGSLPTDIPQVNITVKSGGDWAHYGTYNIVSDEDYHQIDSFCQMEEGYYHPCE